MYSLTGTIFGERYEVSMGLAFPVRQHWIFEYTFEYYEHPPPPKNKTQTNKQTKTKQKPTNKQKQNKKFRIDLCIYNYDTQLFS